MPYNHGAVAEEHVPIGEHDLRAAEAKFTHGKGETHHGDQGGDRMRFNGYAPIYEKYLPTVLGVADPGIAEVGILAGTGLAMWTELFPNSKVFGGCSSRLGPQGHRLGKQGTRPSKHL